MGWTRIGPRPRLARVSSRQPHHAPPPLPPELRWLLYFQGLNSVNFTIALGAPLVLTARYLGAGESAIGILNSIQPLLVMLQLFATNLVYRFGCKRMLLWGWGLRSYMLLLIAPLPLMASHGFSTMFLTVALILPVAGFNAIRGFASGAWFPWIAEVVPEEQRGQYLGKEQSVMNICAFLTLLGCGAFLGSDPPAWRFGALFVFAWAAGMGSVLCLRRAPEPARLSSSAARPPNWSLADIWRKALELWALPGFRRTTRYVLMMTFAFAALPVYLVLFVREELGWPDGAVLKFQSLTMLGVLLTAVYWGSLSDRVGSRPLIRLSGGALLAACAFWAAAGLHLFKPGLWLVGGAYFLFGVFNAAHAIAQMRLVLATIPREDQVIGNTVFQVLVALSGGAAPLIFGVTLDWLRHGGDAGGQSSGLAPFAVVFGAMLGLGAAAQALLGSVPEAKALPAHAVLLQLVYDWPVKVLSSVAGPAKDRRDNSPKGK